MFGLRLRNARKSWSQNGIEGHRQRLRYPPEVEVLDARDVPATFLVTNTGSGDGSLYEAIRDANTLRGSNSIQFAIPGTPNQVQTIVLSTPLPAITSPLTINGYSQSGAQANTDAKASNAQIRIELDLAGPAVGLDVERGGAGTVIKGLAIYTSQNDPKAVGIRVGDGANNTTIEGDFIGLSDGGGIRVRLGRGISILASDKNVIGGEQPAARNVISLNDVGVDLGAKSSQDKVLGNLIGTNPQGASALGNSVGIQVAGSRNQIGSATGGRNVISGNATNGIDLSGGNNQVTGNYIGTDRLGTTAVANKQNGIRVAGEHAKNNIIGGIVGTRNGEGNVISGNSGNGLLITGQTVTSTRVFGNSIGTTANGTGAVPNGSNGILTEDSASEVEIGGPVPGDSNLISGNTGNGIRVAGGAAKVTIQENTIGLNAAGMKLGNNLSGIAIDGAATHAINVGRLNFGNFISGNNRNGVSVNAAKEVTITAERIGTTPAGNNIGNGGNGIDLTGAAQTFIGRKADDGNTIAGNVVGIRVASSTQTDVNLNVVSGNNGAGLQVVDSAQTQVDRNVIGLSADQSATWGNKAQGISLDGSRQTTITDNVIAANGAAGVLLGHNSNTTTLTGNFIGTPSLSGVEQKRGNVGFGVAVQGGFNNTIGKPGHGNAILFNTGGSVQVESPSAKGNSIRGNAMSGGGSAIVLLNHANDNLSAPVLTKLEKLIGAFVRVTGTLDEQHQQGKEFYIDFYGVGQDGILIYIASLQRKTDQDGLAIYREDLHVPNGVTSIRATATLTAPGSTTMLSNGLAVSAAG